MEAILFAIDGLASDGLRPADYHRHGLHEALARFRDEHRQTPDRVLGRATLSALNVPVSDRFGQMRVTSSVHAG